jgi:hypothetical protein
MFDLTILTDIFDHVAEQFYVAKFDFDLMNRPSHFQKLERGQPFQVFVFFQSISQIYLKTLSIFSVILLL